MTPATQAHSPIRESWLVEASAGTGKTKELVRRIVMVLAETGDASRIVAVTFTNAAAGELRLRVREALDAAWRTEPDADRCAKLAEALETLERAFIGTIHAFCAHLLRLRPVEAGVDPAFEELAEAEPVFARVFRRWIEERLQAPAPALKRVFARFAWEDEWRQVSPIDSLRLAAWKLVEWRDYPAEWSRREFDITTEIDALVEATCSLRDLRARCERPRDPLFTALRAVAEFADRAQRTHAAGGLDYDSCEAELLRLPRVRELRYLRAGSGSFARGVGRECVVQAWTQLKNAIEDFRLKADADLAVALRDELQPLLPAYERAKRRAGQLDFMDLLLEARKLLRHPQARCDLRQMFNHVFIDEFQDTDPLQAEILMLLTSDAEDCSNWSALRPREGKLFVAGDPKQSIYRFRRADVSLYERIRENLAAAGVSRATLQSSQRSTSAIHAFVNAAFRESLPAYLPLEGGRDPIPEQPGIVALPMPRPYGSQNLSKVAIERCSPVAVAAFIEWLVGKSGWRVSERDGTLRPVTPGDICILFRRFTQLGADITQEYVRALEARGLEHVLAGSKSFHQREEVAAIRTALRAVEWPDDELSLYATIRTFFAVFDSTLFRLREAFGRLHPFMTLPEDLDPEFEPVRDALTLFSDLHRRRNARPAADTINILLDHVRAHAGFAFRKGGRRVLANVYRLIDVARRFEADKLTSFRAFVEYLEGEAQAGGADEAPIIEQEAGGVKLMTVHKAKGREFPVVILADVTAGLTGAPGGDRYVDPERGLCGQRLLGWAPWDVLENARREEEHDREEALRVAYVAATRARDLLVVAAVGDLAFRENPDFCGASWLAPLYDALYPAKERWHMARPAPGCPRAGETTVLHAPVDISSFDKFLQPGLHVAKEGGCEIAWFDPAVLDLTDRKDSGIEHEVILSGTPAQTRAGIERYARWKREREHLVHAASVPAFDLRHPAEADSSHEAHADIEVVALPAKGARPAGRRFGKLVHALLASWSNEPLETAARARAAPLLASEAEIAAAIAAVRTAKDHPLLIGARAAARCHYEMPLTVRLEDGTMAEGRADLVYSDGVQWTAIDFKTGPARRQAYQRQLATYAAALREATGMPVRAVLFEI
jgi:ATP-dependent exoDNAse (exonuclease V) beta subunit